MKRLLPCLFICLSISVFAQKKYEFGISARAGTFTMPRKADYYLSMSIDSRLKPGLMGATGVYQKVRLGPWLFLSSELLLRYGYYQTSARQVNQLSGQTFYAETDNSFREFSLSLPVKLHACFGAKKRFGMYIGLGISRTLRDVSSQFSESGSKNAPVSILDQYNFQSIGIYDTNSEISFVSGLSWQLNRQVTLRLDWTMEANDQFLGYTDIEFPPFSNYVYPYYNYVKLRSLSFCIYTNLAREKN